MNQKKVSVIIPAYNAANYIERCLDSIIGQTYKNLEIIVIDDGSKDNTREKVEKYSAENSAVRYAYQENTGAAGARNNGISLVSGDYITFCDSDDTLIPSFIETLVGECEKGADMAVAGYMNITEEGRVLAKRSISEKPLGIYANVATCGKLYRTEFVKKADLRFLKGATLFEDSYFTLKAYNSAEKIGVSSMIGYQIYENPASVTRTTGKSMAVVDSVIETFGKIKADITPKDKEIFDYFLIKSAIYTILFSCKGAEKKDLYSGFDKLFAWVDNNTEGKNRYINPIVNNGEIFSVRFVVWGFRLLKALGLAKLAVLIYSKI
ncbi:MAG: glycosyltransferase family 2 protein [Clostridia bacterium]|nr:glycosyltransferase family 2 protein [Clostridia bacterium]